MAVATGALAWLLDRGPLPLPPLAHLLEREIGKRGGAVRVGQASIAWNGFSAGAAAPVRLLLADLAAAPDSAEPPLRARKIEAAFPLARVFAGQYVPEELTIEGLRAELGRAADGRVSLGLAAATATLPAGPANAPAPAQGGDGGGEPAWRSIQHVHVHDAAVTIYDAVIGLSWRVARADIDLDRAGVGLAGQATIALEAAGREATLSARAAAVDTGTEVTLALTPLRPASLADLAPAFAPAGGLDAPVTLTGAARLDTGLGFRSAHLEAVIGAGTIHAGTGTAPLLSATAAVDATASNVAMTARLETAPRPDGPRTLITSTLQGERSAGAWEAKVAVDLDRVSFADLPALWPAGTGGPGTRPWITKNIPVGDVGAGHLDLALRAPADLSDVALTSIHGGLDGRGLEVHWLRPVPPIVQAEARLTIDEPDVIEIAVIRGRQARPPGAPGRRETGGRDAGLLFDNGKVRLTGIAGKDQFADIGTDLSGQVADLLGVLNHPRVRLLSKRPLQMRDPSGQVRAHLVVGHLPLRDDISLDDLAIGTQAHFANLHLGGLAGGRDLDRGDLDLTADNDGLKVSGRADLAGFPSRLRVGMDFRAGGPNDVVQDVSVATTVDDRLLARRGIDTYRLLRGTVELQARARTWRGGRGEIVAGADLAQAALAVPQLGFAKPEGQPTRASLRLRLDHDRLSAIDELRVIGPDIEVRGSADVANGRPELLRLDRIRLGAGTDARGSVRLPTRPGLPYVVAIAGDSLDASGPFESQTDRQPAKPHGQPAKPRKAGDGPRQPFVIDARFGRVLLGGGRRIEGVVAHAENDGKIIRAANLSGTARAADAAPGDAPGAAFRMAIVADAGGRRATADVPDAGGLLAALDLATSIRGGHLTLDARFDDRSAAHPLAGQVVMERFRLLDAPLVARILKAATLYGIIDLLRGPGIGFVKLVAPFRFQDNRLELADARAYSASLGGTVRGSLDLDGQVMDLTGTVVPAYALNTLPGRIPLVGRLFSPEKSGGLFAATFAARGSINSPDISVNPLATLTPGILREVFTLFDAPKPATP